MSPVDDRQIVELAREILIRDARFLPVGEVDSQVARLARCLAAEAHLFIQGLRQEAQVTQDPEFYVTVTPAVENHHFNAVVMRKGGDGDYSAHRVSAQMSRIAADSLARSWAAAGKWDVR